MRAMLLHQPGRPLALETVPDPVPGPGQVLLQVEACGVCRTDLHLVDGEVSPGKLPLVLGHEIVGRVVATGSEVTEYRVGDRAGVPWLAWTCGVCRFCRAGRENLCERALFTGKDVDGGYAELAVANARYCVRIPDRYSREDAAPLLCAGLIGYRAFRLTREASTGSTRVDSVSQKLGIFGFGAAGHLIAQVAVALGRRVFAFTRPGDLARQQLARHLGAEWAGDSTMQPPAKLDAAILFAPVGALVPAALGVLEPGGVVVCGGIHMTDVPSFPYSLLWQERVVRSVANLTRADERDFFDLLHRVPVKVQSHAFPLDRANDALDALRTGKIEGAAVLVPSP